MSVPRAISLLAALGVAACLSDPVFEQPTSSTSETEPADDMALIPAVKDVASFWLDVHEVVGSDWDACAAVHVCGPRVASDSAALPVAGMTRDSAAAYCTWRGKRLPTSDEWTAAAAGAANRTYPWGNAAPNATCVNGAMSDAFAMTAPPGSFPKGDTPDGVEDLAGNVAEWVDADPPVVRGGSYADTDGSAFKSTASRPFAADSSAATVGFRCARDE